MFNATRKTIGFILAMALFLFVLSFLMVGMAAKADAGKKHHARSGGSVNVWEDTYCRNPHHGGCGPIARGGAR